MDVRHVIKLRNRTNYPALRGLATFVMIAGYALAALLAIGAFSALMTSSTGGVLMLLVMVPSAVIVVLLTHLLKELMSMAADAADAVVRTAELLEHRVDTDAPNLDWDVPVYRGQDG